jgi:nicotinate-nucleotide adenylyltransferase
MRQRRIGMYSGTFNPVHAGHIAFAIQAMEIAHLDELYFLPERRPRYKQQVEHFAHRVAMVERAIRPHRHFGVLEMVDINFTVNRTLPKLEHQFAGSQLVFLFGSDAVVGLPHWAYAERLLTTSELVVAVRSDQAKVAVERMIAQWLIQPKAIAIINSYAPEVSSGSIREALRQRRPVRGLLQSVARYSNNHWLYISLTQPKR